MSAHQRPLSAVETSEVIEANLRQTFHHSPCQVKILVTGAAVYQAITSTIKGRVSPCGALVQGYFCISFAILPSPKSVRFGLSSLLGRCSQEG